MSNQVYGELAERVEALSGPDRGVDVAIAVATDWRWPGWEEGEPTAAGQAAKHGIAWLIDRAEDGMASRWRGIPRYTASLDAAMTLVPDGLMWAMDSWSRSQWSAGIWRHQKGWLIRSDVDHQFRTPTLALVAASLRARGEE